MNKPKNKKRGAKVKLRHDLSGFSAIEVAEVFGMTLSSISQFGCPKHTNGTMDLGEVLRWYLAKQKEKPKAKIDLESEKLRLQCEKMEIDLEKMKAENISVETHKQILASRAMSLKNFIQEFYDKNVHLYAHKSIDQLRPMVKDHVSAMLNHYSSNHK